MAHITAEDLSLHFPIYSATARSMKRVLLNLSAGGRINKEASRIVVEALKSLNFELRDGDRLGLIGHNGAGKTSLLRVLSGIYAPTMGRLRVEGRVSSLLDVTLGLQPNATGYENIMLRGLFLGMSPSEVRAKMDAIAEFSELGEYLNLQTRTYSAGMVLRLAFSVATSIQPEIVLMDEWIATGDAQFIRKAELRLNEMIESSRIFVLASHSPDLIRRFCNKTMTLEKGRLVSLEAIEGATEPASEESAASRGISQTTHGAGL